MSTSPHPTRSPRPGAPPSGLSTLETRSDEDLLRRARVGEAAAYGEIFRRYEHRARHFARSLVAPDDVDDVVAESFAKVLRALRGGKGPVDQPVRYLMTAVRTTAATHHARRARASQLAPRLVDREPIEQEVPLSSDDRVAVAFRSLAPRWRQVIWWSEIDGLSPGEIGERLDLSPAAAAALTGHLHLFLELGCPDHLSAKTHASVDARQR